MEQHDAQLFMLLTVPKQVGTHTFGHGNIYDFLSSIPTVMPPTSGSGPMREISDVFKK